MPRTAAILALFLVTSLPTGAHAQAWRASVLAIDVADPAPGPRAAPLQDSTTAEPPTLLSSRQPGLFAPIAGGVIGGTIGLFTGAVIGSAVSNERTDTIKESAAWGLVIGESLLLPVGVHVGNREQGNLLADLAVSTGVGAATILLGQADNSGGVYLVGVVGQFVAVVATERATAKLRNESAARKAWEASLISRAAVKPWIEEKADSAQVAPAPAAADSARARTLRPMLLAEFEPQPPLVQPAVIASLAAVGGAFLGGTIGHQSDEDYEYLPTGAVLGYFIGETVALPIGAHFGNGRHGSFLGDLGVSLLGHLAAIGLGAITSSALVYAIGMGGQIAITVANERAVGARRGAY